MVQPDSRDCTGSHSTVLGFAQQMLLPCRGLRGLAPRVEEGPCWAPNPWAGPECWVSGPYAGGNRGWEATCAEASWPLVFSTSDDNLLKNIELFDKLALRFHGRLLFLKDVLGDEICCWSFYGQGRKIAEVCCTSIVYATEKKQTKVRRGSGPGQGGLWWLAGPGP